MITCSKCRPLYEAHLIQELIDMAHRKHDQKKEKEQLMNGFSVERQDKFNYVDGRIQSLVLKQGIKTLEEAKAFAEKHADIDGKPHQWRLINDGTKPGHIQTYDLWGDKLYAGYTIFGPHIETKS